MLNRPTVKSAAVGTRQPVVDPTLTLVANYLLCIESFARTATLNCERSGPHPAKPPRDALAECVGDLASVKRKRDQAKAIRACSSLGEPARCGPNSAVPWLRHDPLHFYRR